MAPVRTYKLFIPNYARNEANGCLITRGSQGSMRTDERVFSARVPPLKVVLLLGDQQKARGAHLQPLPMDSESSISGVKTDPDG